MRINKCQFCGSETEKKSSVKKATCNNCRRLKNNLSSNSYYKNNREKVLNYIREKYKNKNQ